MRKMFSQNQIEQLSQEVASKEVQKGKITKALFDELTPAHAEIVDIWKHFQIGKIYYIIFNSMGFTSSLLVAICDEANDETGVSLTVCGSIYDANGTVTNVCSIVMYDDSYSLSNDDGEIEIDDSDSITINE